MEVVWFYFVYICLLPTISLYLLLEKKKNYISIYIAQPIHIYRPYIYLYLYLYKAAVSLIPYISI